MTSEPANPAGPPRLFAYGTLAPGRPNGHVLAEVPGTWEPATMTAALSAQAPDFSPGLADPRASCDELSVAPDTVDSSSAIAKPETPAEPAPSAEASHQPEDIGGSDVSVSPTVSRVNQPGPQAVLRPGISGLQSGEDVKGQVVQDGWGAALGYGALVLDPDATDVVSGMLLTSAGLEEHWERFDEFEEDNYQRVTVNVTVDKGTQRSAQTYVLRTSP